MEHLGEYMYGGGWGMKAVAGREEWVPHQAEQVHLLGLIDD